MRPSRACQLAGTSVTGMRTVRAGPGSSLSADFGFGESSFRISTAGVSLLTVNSRLALNFTGPGLVQLSGACCSPGRTVIDSPLAASSTGNEPSNIQVLITVPSTVSGLVTFAPGVTDVTVISPAGAGISSAANCTAAAAWSGEGSAGLACGAGG